MEDWEITERLEQAKQKLIKQNIRLKPCPENNVLIWEKQWGVKLPDSYRRFITEVTNGFKSTRREFLPLEQSMTTARGTDWAPNRVPDDFLRKPFPHTKFFNPDFSPEIKTASELPDEQYSLWWLNQLSGTILLEEQNDGNSTFLIVTGPSRGEVWCDLTVVGQGYDRIKWNLFDWLALFN